ncbi:MAG: hypothetical protein R3E32_02155 [Chitinophagales bacterium]
MQHFSSKILLFGEYSVIVGGNALAIPFEAYHGQFRFLNLNSPLAESANWSNRALQQFVVAIEEMIRYQKLSLIIDLDRFVGDLQQGLFFDSNIPKGYGLGSSGAVVAGVVSKYGNDSAEELKINSLRALQQQFAVLESHFHGQSSGFDPLVCYLNQAVLKTKNEVRTIEVDMKQEGEMILFLIDTQLSRETEPLVQYFLNRLETPDFDFFCREQLKPVNDVCIEAFLEGNGKILKDSIHQLSVLQWKYFQRMIPNHFRSFWENGLESGKYVLKLCGAGGGGCMMGMADLENWGFLEKTFGKSNLNEVCRVLF